MRFFLTCVLLAALGYGGWSWTSADHDEHGHHHGAYTDPWERPSPQPDRVALSWSRDPATSLSVSWRTDTTVTQAVAQVALATPAPNLEKVARTLDATTERLAPTHVEGEAHVRAHYHAVTFEGLLADTLYAYRVGDGTRWSEWFQARTASAEPDPMAFLYFGDAQNAVRTHWSRAIRAAYQEAPEARFVIHAGDLINRAHRNAEWGEWFVAGGWIHGMLPIVAIPGNHEYERYTEDEDTNHLSVHWRPQFELPRNGPPGLEETVYYLDVQGVRVIGLNTNERIEDQADWLADVLADNPNRWTVVVCHHPVFSTAGRRDNVDQRAAWKPLLDRYGVDLVLQGHDHTYARGRTVNVAAGANLREPVSGTVYVSSVSGPKMYATKDNRWDDYDDIEMERAAENTQLFQVIRVDGDTLSFHAFDVTGQLYDAFDLVKRPNGPNRFLAHPVTTTPERTHENTVPAYDRAGF